MSGTEFKQINSHHAVIYFPPIYSNEKFLLIKDTEL